MLLQQRLVVQWMAVLVHRHDLMVEVAQAEVAGLLNTTVDVDGADNSFENVRE